MTPVYYVISKDAKSNILVVGEADQAVNDLFEVAAVNLLNPNRDIEAIKGLYVRIRHGGELIGARVGKNASGLLVEMVKEVRGVAVGQSAVFYDGEGECLGGGVIQ